jgi:hypothetical protein|tara:strand:- start:2461 stop:2592 length:132 start_codon:yes stop_codon:yes gene_type:complete
MLPVPLLSSLNNKDSGMFFKVLLTEKPETFWFLYQKQQINSII